jgi:Helix-turn-helix domain
VSPKNKPQIGQTFNPYKKFTGLLIPEALARSTLVSPGAKLVYGRLARYAGQNGNAHPAVPSLAAEVGLKKRQVQNHLAALEKAKLIRRIPRSSASRQTNNAYVFLWHEMFEDRVHETAPGGVQDPAGGGVQDVAHEESPIEESHFEEKDLDLDCLPRIAKTGDSRQESSCSQYPRLRDELTDYMVTDDDPARVYPSDRMIVDVMNAAGGASEDEVIECLRYLRNERGLLPGTKYGPRTLSWFKTVVADHFYQKANREIVFTLQDSHGQKPDSGLSQDQIDQMSDAFDTN